MVKKRIFYLTGSFLMVLLIALTVFFIAIASKTSANPKAEAPDKCTITIQKTPTVTVYVSGDGVDKVESTTEVDVYEVTKETMVSLRAVNESKIFTNWEIISTDNSNVLTSADLGGIDLTSSYVAFKASTNLTIEALRKNPLKADFGHYMQDAFLINKAITLTQLEKMFIAGNDITKINDEIVGCYNAFFAQDEMYQTAFKDANVNIKEAIRDIFFERIQNGYYLISSPFMIFQKNYYGVGNETYPFKGVMCGLNAGNISNVFINTTCDEKDGNNYSGLFGVLEEEAVVRNLNIDSSIAFSCDINRDIDNVETIFAGGLAGVIKGGYLYNLNVSTEISINCFQDHKIYIGGLAGKIESGENVPFGLDSDNKVTCKLTDSTWIVTNKSIQSLIYIGGIAGFAKNTYIKSINIDVSNYKVSTTSDFRETNAIYSPNANVYLANGFGYYQNTMPLEVKNINIIGDKPENLVANISAGNAYVAGLIGYITSSANLQLGRIKFNIPTGQNTISAQSLDRDASANLYAGGLIAKIEDDSNQYIMANDDFKNGVEEFIVDGINKKSYNAIFDANYNINSTQRGKSDGQTYGKSVAGGLVGYGYINVNGTPENPSNIVVSLEKYNLTVNAIQDTTTTTTIPKVYNEESKKWEIEAVNDKEHCVAGLVYGLFGTQEINTKIENINYYIASGTAKTTRNLGSTAGGDLHTGGLAGYAYDVSFENINLYMNNSYVITAGYSYDCTWNNYKKVVDANNVYTGGVVGEFSGDTSGTPNTVMKNVQLVGWDYTNHEIANTSLKIISIQNTPSAKTDYSAENYCGGIIGRLRRANVDGATYKGDFESYVYMQSNENPDTSFCGGIIGYIRNDEKYGNEPDPNITVQNCLVEKATIRGTATCIVGWSDVNIPDMYVGGIIGGCFNGNTWGSRLSIDNCRVYESTVEANGNERLIVYSAGILAINTWQGVTNISNCYVYRSYILSNLYCTNVSYGDASTYAAGIMAESKTDATISYCASIDTEISCLHNNPGMRHCVAAGIAAKSNYDNDGRYKNDKIINCYSNSSLKTTVKNVDNQSKAHCYGIAPNTFNINDTNKNEEAGPDISSSYYMESRAGVTEWYNNFVNINVAERLVNSSDGVDGDRIFPRFFDEHAFSTKFYPISLDEKFDINNLDVTDKRVTLSIKSGYTNATDTLRVWVNIKQNGDTKNPTDYASDFERHEAGWFLFGRFLIKTGNPNIQNDQRIQIDQISYPIDDKEYICDSENIKDGKVENTFINTSYPYDRPNYIGYEQNTTLLNETDKVDIKNVKTENDITTTTTETKKIIGRITVYVHDDIPQLRLLLRVRNAKDNWDSHYLAFFDDEGNRFYPFANNVEYGRYTYNKSYDGNDEIYEWLFTPNKALASDKHFYIGWILGTEENYKYSSHVIEVTLVANTFELVGFQYANYTLPINYFDKGIGTQEKPWLIKKNSVIKIIPIFTKKNDLDSSRDKPLYISEQGITFVNYSIDKKQLTDTQMNSNGELKTGNIVTSNGVNSSVTISLINDPTQKVTVYFRVFEVYDVTYSSLGSNTTGLLFAYNSADYTLNLDINFGYCGLPLSKETTDLSYVRLGDTFYTMNQVIANGWLRKDNLNLDPVTEFEVEIEKYILIIPKEEINANIDIHIEFEKAYTITFDSQAQSFNNSITNTYVKTYLIPEKIKFNDYFNEVVDEANQKTRIDELFDWTKDNGIFGYVLMGYHLIDNASSIPSYGVSFREILQQNIEINTTYTFYARWSFLIEIVEAPGTHIKTSFSSDFLENYGIDSTTGAELSTDELKELGLNRAITIPINNNKGYVFTIEEDENFIGEADVQVFICSKEGEEKVLTEIDIEKYFEDMYLYRIPPELINGYLIIATSVSNSELIVGENTSQIMDNILPEDGVYTFKYIANHYYTDSSKSYIYDTERNNLALNRDMILKFYHEVYNSTTNKITLETRPLVENTVIEVYYHQYINGVYQPGENIVGTYFVKNGNTTEVRLSDFKKLNENEQAFTDTTFETLLKDSSTGKFYEMFSEVFYFVITPPNGHTGHIDNEFGTVCNRHVYAGYYDSSEADSFVKGKRVERDLANIPLQDQINKLAIQETSCHIRHFSVVPSRITELEQVDGSNTEYLFKDITDYHAFDLTMRRGKILPNGILSFKPHSFDAKENTYVESDLIKDGIKDITLSIGFNLGEVVIYGKTNSDALWEEVGTIEIDSYEYKEYQLKFDVSKKYEFFQIRNNSEQEIRVDKISFSTITNGMSYEFTSQDIQQMVDSGSNENEFRAIHVRPFDLFIYNGYIPVDGIIRFRKYDVATNAKNTYVESSKIEDRIKSLTISIGGINSGTVDIYGKIEEANEWQLIQTITLDSVDYKNYTIDFGENSLYKYFKICNKSDQEISMNYLSYKTVSVGRTYEYSSTDIPNLNVTETIHLREEIKGDTRHDGKHFVMAVQFKDNNGNIVEDISKDMPGVSITVNGKTYDSIHGDTKEAAVYYDLTAIMNDPTYARKPIEITVEIHCPEGYSVYCVELLEVSSIQKPAMSEVRGVAYPQPPKTDPAA